MIMAARKKSASTHKLVRIKPFNKRRGQIARRYHIAGRLFRADKGWHKVSAALAKKLEEIEQPGHPGVRMFDVTDVAGAKKIEADAAKKARENRGVPDDPVDLTTDDLGAIPAEEAKADAARRARADADPKPRRSSRRE